MQRLTKILFLMGGVSFVSFVLVRFILGTWVPFLWLALGFFVLFVAAGLWTDRVLFKEFFGMKTTKEGLSMGSSIVMVLLLIIVANYFGARYSKTFDLSANKVNSLSEQSITLIKNLKENLKVIYFYKEGLEGVEQNRRAFIDLLRKYQDQTSKVELEFVEVNSNPAMTEKYGIKKGSQSVILEYSGKTNLIEKIDEQEITSALVKVTRDKDKTVYLLAGHGELPLIGAADGNSVANLKAMLDGNRYTIKPLSFTDKNEVPADADVVMILGPTQQFLDIEIKAIESYLRKGGGLFLALEPKAKHGLDPILKNFGLKIEDHAVVTVMDTPMGRAVDPRFTRANVFSAGSSMTKPFGKSEFTVFRLPGSISRIGSPKDIALDDIVRTNDSSMAFNSLEFSDEGKKGPFTIAVQVKGKYEGASQAAEFGAMVVADRDFLNDTSLYQNLNRDLVLNAVATLAREENQVSITPKEVGRTQLSLMGVQFTIFVLGFVSLTLALFGASGMLWWRRRYS